MGRKAVPRTVICSEECAGFVLAPRCHHRHRLPLGAERSADLQRGSAAGGGGRQGVCHQPAAGRGIPHQRHLQRDEGNGIRRTAQGACRHLTELAPCTDGTTQQPEEVGREFLLLRQERRRTHQMVRPRRPYHLRRLRRRPLSALPGHHQSGGTEGGGSRGGHKRTGARLRRRHLRCTFQQVLWRSDGGVPVLLG